jgi:two-component system copper resistance phosphate regulon response regulator CusR
VLSAISDSEERAKVLDLGADDYQGKPYSLVELLSRVRALLRRSHDGGGGEKTVLHIGNLDVHLLEHSAKVGATALDLTPKEFRLLSILVREPGKVWSKFKLLDQVWQVNLELESNVVESTVRNIRRKLEQAGCSAVIESKRNLGYWIEA